MEKILPYILATITQHNRQKVIAGVDFAWSSDSWTHNAFRMFEVLFWRKEGIRREASARAWKGTDGINHEAQAFHTLEALLKFVESKIRNSFKFADVRVSIPMLITSTGFPVFASPYLLAIAFISSAKNTATATSVAITSFSAATTNGLLFADVNMNGVAPITWTSVTCTDGTLTNIDSVVNASHADNNTADYYFLGTTTASQTVTGNSGVGSRSLGIEAGSYSGVKQSGQPDSHNTNTASTGSTFALTTTTVANNCWLVGTTFNGNTTGGAISAGANTTVRQNDANGGSLIDSNAAQTPAGSKSLNVTKTGNDFWSGAIASFAPSVAPTSGFFLAAAR